jgi:hypothetical protein
MSKSVRGQGGRASRHGEDATPVRWPVPRSERSGRHSQPYTSRSLALKTITHAESHAKHVVLEAILANVTLLARVKVPFWLSKVFVQSARSTSTRTRIDDRPALQATLLAKSLAVPHQGPLNTTNWPVAMRCVDPVCRVTRHTRRMRSTMVGCRRLRSAGPDPVGVGPKQMRRGR